jgi:hypothetical protein
MESGREYGRVWEYGKKGEKVQWYNPSSLDGLDWRMIFMCNVLCVCVVVLDHDNFDTIYKFFVNPPTLLLFVQGVDFITWTRSKHTMQCSRVQLERLFAYTSTTRYFKEMMIQT